MKGLKKTLASPFLFRVHHRLSNLLYSCGRAHRIQHLARRTPNTLLLPLPRPRLQTHQSLFPSRHLPRPPTRHQLNLSPPHLLHNPHPIADHQQIPSPLLSSSSLQILLPNQYLALALLPTGIHSVLTLEMLPHHEQQRLTVFAPVPKTQYPSSASRPGSNAAAVLLSQKRSI
jgi:hypothetical protein